jgi:hypothetical protein
MILTIKLNIGDYQSVDFQTNEYDNIANCYSELSDFLGDWVDYTDNAVKLKAHIEAKGIVGSLRSIEGEKRAINVVKEAREAVLKDREEAIYGMTDSNPSEDFQKLAEKTRVEQTQNFVDVRECIDYSEKSYKLIEYGGKDCFIAKQHVIRTESIEGGATRVIVSAKSAWVIGKLEWK